MAGTPQENRSNRYYRHFSRGNLNPPIHKNDAILPIRRRLPNALNVSSMRFLSSGSAGRGGSALLRRSLVVVAQQLEPVPGEMKPLLAQGVRQGGIELVDQVLIEG